MNACVDMLWVSSLWRQNKTQKVDSTMEDSLYTNRIKLNMTVKGSYYIEMCSMDLFCFLKINYSFPDFDRPVMKN